MAEQEEGKSFMRIAFQQRVLPFRGKSVKVYDCSESIQEAPAVSKPGLFTVNAGMLFEPDTVFLGMGQPNVYLAHVYGEDSVKVVAAKSLYREETRVVESHGRVQSGYFFVATNISAEEIEEVKTKAYSAEGTSHITCLNSCMSILGDAGFSSGVVEDIRNYVMPHRFLEALLLGLQPKLKGHELNLAIVKTTPMSLDDYYLAIRRAAATTPFRHLNRATDSDHAKAERKRIAIEISEQNKEAYELLAQAKSLQVGRTFQVQVSETGSLGAFFRSLWGSHIIYKIQLPGDAEGAVQTLLPDALKEFAQAKGFFSTVKKNVLFSQTVVDMVRRHMATQFATHEGFSQRNLVAMLDPRNEGKYNMVVTSKEIIIVSNAVKLGFVDWVLSKHVLICGYSPDVRFAGELWLDDQGVIHINNNSGTFKPTAAMTHAAGELAKQLFPDLRVEVHAEGEDLAQADIVKGDEAAVEADEVVEGDDMWYDMGGAHEGDDVDVQVKDAREALGCVIEPLGGGAASAGGEEDLHAQIVAADLAEERSHQLAAERLAEDKEEVGLEGGAPRDAPPEQRRIGVLLAKFDPLTTHHEATIEAALAAGKFDRLVVVASDVLGSFIHTPVSDRQNMIDDRYVDDPRVLTFTAHSVPMTNSAWGPWGWVRAIVELLHNSGWTPVPVVLWEDLSDPKKKSRLLNMMPANRYLCLYDPKEVDAATLPTQEQVEGRVRAIEAATFTSPPKSEAVREALDAHAEWFRDEVLIHGAAEVPLSPPVRRYIYDHKLYQTTQLSGNLVDGFRAVFGTGLGKALGRVAKGREATEAKVAGKLKDNGINLG